MKASELIQQLQELKDEVGDLDIALVHEVQGFFAFDMFPVVDVFQYPVNDELPEEEDEPLVAVIAIANHKCVPESPRKSFTLIPGEKA